ncbi:MAG: L,D-transpeptidase family protein [Chloroflexota bacterium]
MVGRLDIRRIGVSIAAIMAVAAMAFGFALTSGQIASAQGTQNFSIGSLVATTSQTDLREQPAASGAVVVAMPVNAQAIVLGGQFNDGWYWLNYNGTQGYAQGKSFVPVDANYQPVQEATSTPTSAPKPAATDTPSATGTPASSGTQVAIPSPTTDITTPSTPGDYSGLWLGEMSTGGNVRVGPGLDQKILKGWWAGRRVLLYESSVDSTGGLWYRVSDPPEAPMWVHSSLVKKIAPVKYEGAKYKGKWINVNITQQIVTAYQDGTPVKVTLASTGIVARTVNPTTGQRDDNRTELGVWKIYYKLPKQDMKGGSKAGGDYYDLKDVPFPQYFHISGEGLHGTYWHDDFGHPRSHGCVNLSTPMSEWFYNWDKIGTVVWVHN